MSSAMETTPAQPADVPMEPADAAPVPSVPDVPVSDVISACSDVTGPYDVIMVNTPWHRMSVDELSTLPIGQMAAEDATIFMWTDSAMAGCTARLMKKFGFSFHSVVNILNIAEPQPAVPAPASTTAPDETATTSDTPADADVKAEDVKMEPVEAAEDVPVDDAGAAPKPKAPRAPRIKTLHPPHHWMDIDNMLVRPCTEQLWMGTRGNGAALANKMKPYPFQVSTQLEYAKRSSKMRKPSALCHPEWFCTRPSDFFAAVMKQLSPEIHAIELFGDSVQQKVDTFGPGIPQFFVPALSGTSGDVGLIKAALSGMGKVAVRTLCAKLHKALANMEGALEEQCVIDIFIAIRAKVTEAGGSVDKWVPDNHITLQVVSNVVDSYFNEYPQRKKKTKRSRDESSDSDKSKERHGIAKPGPVSAALVEFFGEPAGTEIARTEVVSRINSYFRDNDLRAGKHFKLDAKLKQLFSRDDDHIDYFRLHELLAPHFPPPKHAKKEKKAKKAKKSA